ncbi:MAG: hypothetical protein HQL21_02945 [Candidatus Omnitrophica bacterium]|nr:hypothetical protein [Candidatus Omnitrophota bacterium]
MLEILITTILLVVGVISVVKALASGTSVDASSENRAIASLLAQERMEELINTSFPLLEAEASEKGPIDADFPEYQREVVITPQVDNEGLTLVTVNVYWTDLDDEYTVTLQTYLVDMTPSS